MAEIDNKAKGTIAERLLQFLIDEPSGDFEVNEDGAAIDQFELEHIKEFSHNFDPTGELTLLYLVGRCRRQIEHTKVPVKAVLANPKLLDVYRVCQSDIAEAAKTSDLLTEKLSTAIGQMTGGKLIGSTAIETSGILDAVEMIFEEFPTLKFEIYANSGRPIGNIDTTSITVQSCGSLAECLLRLEKSPDGIYVGFIANPGTLDGWFGFFVKSNGNMFSYHERIDEEYIGQHGNMRNGRYTDSKAYGLFPYELCEFSKERDYRGYSKEMKIGECLDLLNGGESNFGLIVRMLLAMGLIAKRHLGQPLSGKTVLVNSLLPQNLAQLEHTPEAETTALVAWEGSSLVKATAALTPPRFELAEVLSGAYNREFDDDDGAVFKDINQDMVDAYGNGFAIDEGKVLLSKSSQRLIGNGRVEQEFVGSPERLRRQAYYEVRHQLANHISNQMWHDFQEFGGDEGLHKWYVAELEKRKDKILSYCHQAYQKYQEWKNGAQNDDCTRYTVKFGEEKLQENSPSELFAATTSPLSITINNKVRRHINMPFEAYKYGEILCIVTAHKATMSFLFEFYDYLQVQEFLGEPLPKFCIGWRKEDLYSGNPILYMVDPINRLESPIAGDRFNFSVGLSKSGLNLIAKGKAI